MTGYAQYTIEDLLQYAEEVIDDLNKNKQAMVRSVHKTNAMTAACVAVGGGLFELRKKESLNFST